MRPTKTTMPALLMLAPALLGGCWQGARYGGPVSDHFDGRRFSNLGDAVRPSVCSEVSYHLFSGHGTRPEHVDLPGGDLPPQRVDSGSLHYTWITHNTVLVQADGVNILTDPIWSPRASPTGLLGPKRMSAPASAVEQLPPIDLVLVTHNHYDHMDLPTLRELEDRFHPRVLTGLGDDT